MSQPFVVLVSGVPGSGKTTLARALGDELQVPVLSRDLLKSGLHVTTDRRSASGTRRFSDASFDLFHDTVAHWVEKRVSLIAEAAFHAAFAAPRLQALVASCAVVNVRTRINTSVARDRYRLRAETGLRHESHGDEEFLSRAGAPDFDWSVYELDLVAPAIDVDTTSTVDMARLARQILDATDEE